jgi:hypothetical protein
MRSNNGNDYRNRGRDSSSPVAYSKYYHHYLQDEHSDSKGYWTSELESLGICPKGTNELDIKEVSDFVENLKQVLLEEYRAAYYHHNNSEDGAQTWT